MLRADRLGSISLGSPIFYRDLPVGEVLGWDLGEMAENATIHAFVRAPFDRYVRDGSRFWNASGVSVKLGADGVQLQLESLRALLMGGIAFDTPAAVRTAEVRPAGHVFPSTRARRPRTTPPTKGACGSCPNFPGSVGGLGAGSP